MCGQIHCERHEQNNHKQCQQSHVDADRDFAPHDFPENPQAQPDETDQECNAADYETAIHRYLPQYKPQISYRNQAIFYKIRKEKVASSAGEQAKKLNSVTFEEDRHLSR